MMVKAFQTLEDMDNIDIVELNGPFPCIHKGAWLGYGCYLWDSRIDWAIDWGHFVYTSKQKEFIIGRTWIDLRKECFDLMGNVQHQYDFQEIIKVMIESKKIKKNEEAIVANVIEFMKNKNLFPFKSIRAADMRNVKKYFFRIDSISGKPKEYMMINQRVQICVISKKDVLSELFEVIYPEKYKV
jgi:hypothetical protein